MIRNALNPKASARDPDEAMAGPVARPGRDGEAARDLEALLSDIDAQEALAESWPAEHRSAAVARMRAIDALNAEAFRRLIRSLKAVPALRGALREAAADEVVYAVLRRHGILKPSLFERVEAALDTIRPVLAGHGGDVALVAVHPPVAEVRFLGACDGCPASALTFYAGVKKAIRDAVPEIAEIKQVKGARAGASDAVHVTSPFAPSRDDRWVFAADLGALPDGGTRIVEIDGHSVLLSRFGDGVTCFENACAHMGMAMDGGDIGDGIITCPHHGFRYALESGECLTAPEVQLQPHAARIVGRRVEIQIVR